jgi:hypothetical protein
VSLESCIIFLQATALDQSKAEGERKTESRALQFMKLNYNARLFVLSIQTAYINFK